MSPAMSAAAAAARTVDDDNSTMYFGGPEDPRSAPDAFGGLGELDMLDDDLGPDPSVFDAATGLGPRPGGPEPTPALLAARSEPLGGAPRVQARGSGRTGRNPKVTATGAKPGQAPRTSKKRTTNRTPKEPPAVLLGLGLGAVVLAGLAAFWLLTRGGGDEVAGGSDSNPESVAEAPDDPTASSTPNDTVAAVTEEVAGPETTTPPQVAFDEAAVGPIAAGTEYTVGVSGGPTEANYQLFIDGVPTADPAPALAPVTFEPGRHLLEIAISSTAGNTSTTPVVVYAIGQIPTGTIYRANLSSVNVETQGWAEAVRQFDEYSQSHPNLQLMPSDWFPSLTPGYWNLFVSGFADTAEAEAYCEQAGLAVPTECWAPPALNG